MSASAIRTTRSGAPLDAKLDVECAEPAESAEPGSAGPSTYLNHIRAAIVAEKAPKGSSLASVRKAVVSAVGGAYENLALVTCLNSAVDNGALTLSGGCYKVAVAAKQKGSKKKAKAKAKAKVTRVPIQQKVASLDGVTVTVQLPWNGTVGELKVAYFEARQLEPDSVSLSLFGALGNEDAIEDKQLVSKVPLPESGTLFMLQGLRGVRELKKQLATLLAAFNADTHRSQEAFSAEMAIISKAERAKMKTMTAKHAKLINPLQKRMAAFHKRCDKDERALKKNHDKQPKSQHAAFLLAEQTGAMTGKHEEEEQELTGKLAELYGAQQDDCDGHYDAHHNDTWPLQQKHAEEQRELRTLYEKEKAELDALLMQAVLRVQESEGLYACPACGEKDKELTACSGTCDRQLCESCRAHYCAEGQCSEGSLFCDECNNTELCGDCEQPMCPNCLEDHSCLDDNFMMGGGCDCGMCGFW